MSRIFISQISPLKIQQGRTTLVLLILIIILLIPYGWLGSKIGLMYWNQFATQRAVQSVVTDSAFSASVTLANGASDDAYFQELSKNLSLMDISIAAKDFSINHSINPPVLQVRLHQEEQLTEKLKIVFDDLVEEQIRTRR